MFWFILYAVVSVLIAGLALNNNYDSWEKEVFVSGGEINRFFAILVTICGLAVIWLPAIIFAGIYRLVIK